jgi:hypothetical protein
LFAAEVSQVSQGSKRIGHFDSRNGSEIGCTQRLVNHETAGSPVDCIFDETMPIESLALERNKNRTCFHFTGIRDDFIEPAGFGSAFQLTAGSCDNFL